MAGSFTITEALALIGAVAIAGGLLTRGIVKRAQQRRIALRRLGLDTGLESRVPAEAKWMGRQNLPGRGEAEHRADPSCGDRTFHVKGL